MGLEIAVATRAHDGEGITAARRLDLHLLDGLFERLDIVESADTHVGEGTERVTVKGRDAGLDLDRSDAILLPLLDLEGDQEAFAVRIVFRQRGHHLHVGEAVLQIEAANQVAIGLDPIRIVDIIATQEAQQVQFVGLDDVLQTVGRISLVADELDRFDAGLHTFGDREDEVDAVVRLLDDLGRDTHVVAARAPVDFGDALGVGLHHRTRQCSARLGLDFGRKLLVLDLLVALEGNTTDHRVFNHRDDKAAACAVNLHVLEQAGLDQGLQTVVHAAGVECAVRAGLEVGADRVGFDATVPLDRDGTD